MNNELNVKQVGIQIILLTLIPPSVSAILG